jgi:hypothetical protein
MRGKNTATLSTFGWSSRGACCWSVKNTRYCINDPSTRTLLTSKDQPGIALLVSSCSSYVPVRARFGVFPFRAKSRQNWIRLLQYLSLSITIESCHVNCRLRARKPPGDGGLFLLLKNAVDIKLKASANVKLEVGELFFASCFLGPVCQSVRGKIIRGGLRGSENH